MNVEKFDWTEELHQTMVKSPATSFGLDFLLLNDRKGVMLTLSIMCVMAFMPRRLSDSGMKVVATMILIITTAMKTTSRRTGKESVHIRQGLLLMHIQAKCLLQTIKKSGSYYFR